VEGCASSQAVQQGCIAEHFLFKALQNSHISASKLGSRTAYFDTALRAQEEAARVVASIWHPTHMTPRVIRLEHKSNYRKLWLRHGA
jgi:hypothetical protein